MRKSMVILALPFALVVACGRSRMDREQTEYQVVQEGAATGVTSTLGGAATPPLTGTNADTTTAFTLDPRLSTAPPLQQPGTIAGTLPAQPTYGSSQPAPAARPSAPAARPSQPTYTPSPAPEPERPSTPAPRPPSTTRPAEPPPSDTVEPPPPVDTAPPPTETAPPTTTRPRRDPAPPPTDTAPPPPPTTTDTEGGQGQTESSDGR